MSIQWFPGHMNAAKREAAEQMENIDIVVEVLDARLPEASCNPLVEEIRKFRQRPCLKVLNKIDLADPAATAAWKAYYDAQEGVTAYPRTTKKPADVARIPALCLGLAPHRGVPTKPLRIMIMGIPNVGKSTLMNALLKKRVAKVGDEPAVTKTQQRLYLDKHTVLVDTPGMLWPKIAMASDGLALAASHAIGSNALIEEEVAEYLAGVLRERDPEAARAALDAIAEVGAATISELRALQGASSAAGAVPDLADDLRALSAAAEREGARVRLALETAREIQPDDGGLIRRVVREGLANAVRHAPGSVVAIEVVVTAEEASVSVSNGAATAPAGAGTGTGLGLRGLQELVEDRGGRLRAAPDGDGFVLGVAFALRPERMAAS